MDNTTSYNDDCFFSVIIIVRDRWDELALCLESLINQHENPPFQVIVIDDGSKKNAPVYFSSYSSHIDIKFIQQNPLGIAFARNNGLRNSEGQIILFTDSDCILSRHCLKNLANTIQKFNSDVAFQLKFISSNDSLLFKLVDLRSRVLQQFLILNSGYIRCINTSGFAIKKSFVQDNEISYDTKYIRGSDSGLLLKIFNKNLLPRYASDAVVYHLPRMPLLKYIFGHLSRGYYDGPVLHELNQAGNIRLTMPEKFRMSMELWRQSKGTLAFILVMVTYILELSGRLVYRLIKSGQIFKSVIIS